MDLLEYQGKRYLARYGLPVPEGEVAGSVQEAGERADALGYPVAVKAQVATGGRGKAGGIRLAGDRAQAEEAAGAILGMDIRGHRVRLLWLERAVEVATEHYASFTLDRAAKLHLGLVSARGGVDIEEVAASDPEAVARLHVNPLDGLSETEAGRLVEQAGLSSDVAGPAVDLLLKLFEAYSSGDADLVEVNPLVVTAGGQLLALDAKVTLDDNAAFRHPEWGELGAGPGLDERTARARARGLNYIGLTGSVGVIGNGAGLVMSTLDVVAAAGGAAANFLDVGGGAKADVIAAALDVVNSDEQVRCILVNIFGGITRGDEVARGILEALGRVELRSPIVVRLDGTNAAEGRALLAGHESERMISRPTMLDAARTAVALAGSAR